MKGILNHCTILICVVDVFLIVCACVRARVCVCVCVCVCFSTLVMCAF